MSEIINFNDFKKIDLRVAEVKTAEKVEGSEKLVKLQVDIGESELRQLVAGIAGHYKPSELVGKKIVVLANLESKKLMGVESRGMLLACLVKGEEDEKTPVLIVPEDDVKPGSIIS